MNECMNKKKLFQKADTDGDGKLSVDEYYTVLKDHNIKYKYISRLILWTQKDKVSVS